MEREQALVFGEVAEQYDAARPGYPDAVFDAVIEYGGLRAGDRALEIGAGTGKATVPFAARGLDITPLEPSAGMAELLRTKGFEPVEQSFDAYEGGDFALVFGAQSWHWVTQVDRYEHLAACLAPGGTVALFWNLGEEWDGQLGADNDAVYARYAPHLTHAVRHWDMDSVLVELKRTFPTAEKRLFPWSETYTRAECVRLLGTHSDHRMLDPDVREQLHAAIGDVVDAHGGTVTVNYEVNVYLARNR
jgi:SAM-dependent methyltransferase